MFLMAAMICGEEPVRTWDRSSSKVTSRTWCSRFSMLQCPRLKARTSAGLAWQVVRLVMPYTVSLRARSGLACRSDTSRVIAQAW